MNDEAAGADCRQLRQQEGAASRIMAAVTKIIHVDNRPRDYDGWERSRQQSRDRLMAQLVESEDIYKPPDLVEVNARISDLLDVKHASEAKLKALIQEQKKLLHDHDQQGHEATVPLDDPQGRDAAVPLKTAIDEEKEKCRQVDRQLFDTMDDLMKQKAGKSEGFFQKHLTSLGKAVDSAMGSALGSEVGSALGSEVGSAVGSAALALLKAKFSKCSVM